MDTSLIQLERERGGREGERGGREGEGEGGMKGGREGEGSEKVNTRSFLSYIPINGTVRVWLSLSSSGTSLRVSFIVKKL